MNRDEFMRQLERLLMNIPENDRLDAIAYYNDYFDDAGVENEQKVITELGSPEKVAGKIKEDLETSGYNEPQGHTALQEQNDFHGYDEPQQNTTSYAYENFSHAQNQSGKTEKKNIPWVLIIIIAVLTFPLWIGIVAGLFGILFGILGALIGIICGIFGGGIGMTISGFFTMIAGFFIITTSPLEAFTMIGVGALLTAIGLLLFLLFVLLAFKWIPALVKAITRGIKGLLHRNEGGNGI